MGWSFGTFEEISKRFDIQTTGIIHVGAQHALETDEYERAGVGHIMWFEANADHVNQYYTNAKPRSAKVIMYNALLSDTDDEDVTFYVASNEGGSSSLLRPAKHSTKWPEITFRAVPMRTRRFDTFVSMFHVNLTPYNFLAIDVQGAELKVLKGFGEHLHQMKTVALEVAEEFFYENQALYTDIHSFLTNNGYELRTITLDGFGEALYTRKDT